MKIKLHWQIIIGLVLGLIYGIISASMGWGLFTKNWIVPFGDIFLNLLKLIAVPLVISSLITGVASLADIQKLSRIGGKTIAIYISTTAIAVTIGLLLVNSLQPGKSVPQELQAKLQATYEAEAGSKVEGAETVKQRGPLQIFVDMVPSNFFDSAADNGNMLQIVFVSILFGVALILIPAEKSQPLINFFDGMTFAVIKVVDIIMLLAPYGVFALIAKTINTVAADNLSSVIELLSALGFYCIVVLIGLLIHTAVTYPSLLKIFTKMPVTTFFKGIGPAQVLAFSTSSSGATLPVTMERCEKNLGVSEEISSFVLPLGATINMDGTALYQAVAAVFIAQALGLGLGLTAQLQIILTAVLASIGTAAVPGAGIIMLVIILETVGVPTAGIALILGVDRILDMCRTVTNITGDATVATCVAATEGQLGTASLDDEVVDFHQKNS
ncbi:MAG: dicarboxylate/amino acid:cation symporter [Deferribacteres bacterium]|nr:dicarboxylate/amino acid:cation symporter [candidate division KSB1 bacterium]MCB9508647.1 dicarboxylate/amino acid:cation symporter [Deferribacteres bacterium]